MRKRIPPTDKQDKVKSKITAADVQHLVHEVDKLRGPRELLRYDLREKYRHNYFYDWEGRDFPAQHRFVPAEKSDEVRLNFSWNSHGIKQARLVLDSDDGGENWHRVDKWQPPQDRGIYELGVLRMALARAGTVAWVSPDAGKRWYEFTVPHADEKLYAGLGSPNCFSAIMLRTGLYAGRIVMVASYFTGQEGPDCEIICSTYSDDWGASWHCSRLFGPPEPLSHHLEGFGEPAVVELPSGWLWMVFRSEYGELWQCQSRDGGATWSPPTPTGFVSPVANCYATREPITGATVLCWNMTKPGIGTDFRGKENAYHPRTNLVFAVSRDNTRTWTVPVVVEAGRGQYPTIHFATGRMFIMYQKSPGEEPCRWDQMGLELVAYDTRDVLALPAWTDETIRPLIERGLIAPWRALACQKRGETIT